MNNSPNKVLDKNVSNYINYLMGIVGTITLVYGLVHSIKGKSLLGTIDLIIGVTMLGVIIFGRKLSQKVRSLFLTVFFLIFLVFLVYDGATGNVGYLWMIVYPSVIFYILGIKKGSLWVGIGFLSLIALSGLDFMGVLELPYEQVTIVQFNVVYGVMSGLSYLAEKDRSKRSLTLERISKRLSFVIRNSPVVVFILDNKGIFEFSDGAGLEKLGLKPGQVVGVSALEMYKDSPVVVEGVRKALAGTRMDGLVPLGEFFYQTQFSPIIGDNGEVTGVIGLAIDITKEYKSRSEIQVKLKELEKMNNLMVGRETRMMEMKKELKQIKNQFSGEKGDLV